MDLIDRLQDLASQVPAQLAHVHTEEATKNALVMPFIRALGYDVFDPREVVPEFTADVGTKKGEKVDYAILRDGKPIILMECKPARSNLDDEHKSQLYRYFSVTEARFGVLTNGVEYRFFSDLEAPNVMDSRPFLEFRITDVTEELASELKHFAPESFDLERILSTASELKYTKGIMRVLADEWKSPSEEMVRLLASHVFSGRMTQAAREQFREITSKAMTGFIETRVEKRLKSALQMERHAAQTEPAAESSPQASPEKSPGIVTTEQELEGFYTVKAILSGTVSPERVTIRDRKRYCGILLDDTQRKPICRLWFNGGQKYLGLFDEQRVESKHPIESVNGIFEFREHLITTARRYEPSTGHQESS